MCSLKDPQNVFIQSLPLYTSCLLSMLLNEDIVDIEKPDGMCLLAYIVDEFSGIIFTFVNLFYYTFKKCINNKWCFIIFLILIKF